MDRHSDAFASVAAFTVVAFGRFRQALGPSWAVGTGYLPYVQLIVLYGAAVCPWVGSALLWALQLRVL